MRGFDTGREAEHLVAADNVFQQVEQNERLQLLLADDKILFQRRRHLEQMLIWRCHSREEVRVDQLKAGNLFRIMCQRRREKHLLERRKLKSEFSRRCHVGISLRGNVNSTDGSILRKGDGSSVLGVQCGEDLNAEKF
jgi:hypothetical protein